MQERIKLEEGWSTLFLLLAMIVVAAAGVGQSEFFDGLHVLPYVGISAVLTGLLIAKSSFPKRTAGWFALVFGLFTTIYAVAAILPGDLTWRERVLEVINTQFIFIQKMIGGGTNRDGYIFVLHASIGIWVAGFAAAWYTFRNLRIWRVVLPAGLILLSVVYYYAGPKPLPLYLAAYLLLSLLFIARTHLVEQEKQWRSGAVRYERRISLTFLRAGFIASVLAIMLAWSLPAMTASAAVGDALSDVRGPWQEFQNNWTRLYSALRTYGQTTVDPYQDTLVLGGPRTVGDSPVMDIYVAQRLPYVYWQTMAYDTYNSDGGWEKTLDGEPTLHISDEGVLDVPFTLSRQVITQTVVNYLPNSSLMYGAPEVIGSDRDMFVEALPDGNGNSLVAGMRSRYVLKQGDSYEVTSRYSTADATSLRMAGNDYPEWVTDSYLQLPDSITPETLSLADELMAAYDNPFDKAMAVQNYLRDTIAYNDQIDATPVGIEPVHYVLFVSQEAYCTYYSSAMIVMLRSQGIPARMASGYAQGTFNQEDLSYRVLASNSHSWAEVYFPNYGWIQFEPTATIPVIARPENSGDGSGDDAFSGFNGAQSLLDREALLGEDELNSDPADPNSLEDLLPDDEDVAAGAALETFWATFPVWQVVAGVVIVGLATALVVFANGYNQQVEADVERSYGRLENWGRWLGLSIRPIHTPHERAELMTTAVPEGEQPIKNLTNQFVLKQFSRARSYEEGFDPSDEWRTLRPMMLRHTFEHWLERLRNGRSQNRK